MKRNLFAIVALSACLLIPAISAAGQKIEPAFTNVEDYRDLSVSGLSKKKSLRILKTELEEALPPLARRYLPESTTLRLTFTDIDMAGDIQPWRNIQNADIRYVERIYPSRLEFTYELVDEEDAVIREGEESISGRSSQMNAAASIRANRETFSYETTLLEDWLRKTFRDQKNPKKKETAWIASRSMKPWDRPISAPKRAPAGTDCCNAIHIRHAVQNVIGPMCRGLGKAPGVARRAGTPAFAGKGDQKLMAAAATAGAGESVGQEAVFQKAP